LPPEIQFQLLDYSNHSVIVRPRSGFIKDIILELRLSSNREKKKNH